MAKQPQDSVDMHGQELEVGVLAYKAETTNTVTQITDRSTAVTLNSASGVITTDNTSLAAAAAASVFCPYQRSYWIRIPRASESSWRRMVSPPRRTPASSHQLYGSPFRGPSPFTPGSLSGDEPQNMQNNKATHPVIAGVHRTCRHRLASANHAGGWCPDVHVGDDTTNVVTWPHEGHCHL